MSPNGTVRAGAASADPARPLVRTLTLTVFLQWMGATAIVPMLPVYVRHLGGTDGLAGLVMASFYAAGVLSQYPIGRLADRVGRRPVLLAGLVLYGVSSFCFLLPVSAPVTIVLRSFQGIGVGAAAVASLAMIAGAVRVERRGRAFASIYGGELAGMAIGPLIGSILGVRYLWIMFLSSGILSLSACLPVLVLHQRGADFDQDGQVADGGAEVAPRPHPGAPLERLRLSSSTRGAVVAGAAIGLTSGVYDICWTLLLLARGASGLAIGISWTLFAVPFVVAAKPSGWLADHLDRRVLALCGLGVSTSLCALYPFLHSVPLLVVLGASEALGFAAAIPAVQSLLTQGSSPGETGRIQGLFATAQTACTAASAAFAGAAFAVAIWLPFVTAASIVSVALVVTALLWRGVAGRVAHGAPPAPTGAVAAVHESVLAQAPEVAPGVATDVAAGAATVGADAR